MNNKNGEAFALLYISLFVGMLVGNWLPIVNLGSQASMRLFGIAGMFIVLSAAMVWLPRTLARRKGFSTRKTGSVKEISRRLQTPEGRAIIAEALKDHRKNAVGSNDNGTN